MNEHIPGKKTVSLRPGSTDRIMAAVSDGRRLILGLRELHDLSDYETAVVSRMLALSVRDRAEEAA